MKQYLIGIAATLTVMLIGVFLLPLARAVAHGWARLYTLGLPREVRELKVGDARAFCDEYEADLLKHGHKPEQIGLRLLSNVGAGVWADLVWRLSLRTLPWLTQPVAFMTGREWLLVGEPDGNIEATGYQEYTVAMPRWSFLSWYLNIILFVIPTAGQTSTGVALTWTSPTHVIIGVCMLCSALLHGVLVLAMSKSRQSRIGIFVYHARANEPMLNEPMLPVMSVEKRLLTTYKQTYCVTSRSKLNRGTKVACPQTRIRFNYWCFGQREV